MNLLKNGAVNPKEWVAESIVHIQEQREPGIFPLVSTNLPNKGNMQNMVTTDNAETYQNHAYNDQNKPIWI